LAKQNTSAVLELQHQIANDSVGIAVICKTALLIAKKLKQDQIIDWLNLELNGYDTVPEVPRYRLINVEPKFNNPYRGLCPILMPEGKLKEYFNNYPIGQSILSIDGLIINKEKENNLVVNLPAALESHLRKALKKDVGIDFEILGIGNIFSLISIAETVKMKIMNWLLDLEQNGILGENLKFTRDEIKMASGPTQNFYNSTIGVMSQASDNATQNVSIEQTINSVQVEKLVEDILPTLSSLPSEARQEIEKQLLIAKAESKAGNPSKVRQALSVAKRVAEGVTGNVTAAGIIHWLSGLL
jgi:AbiTii